MMCLSRSGEEREESDLAAGGIYNVNPMMREELAMSMWWKMLNRKIKSKIEKLEKRIEELEREIKELRWLYNINLYYNEGKETKQQTIYVDKSKL